jgi:plasmid stabilization system protein ParE
MNVRYRLRALEDLQLIYDWRARQSPNVAKKIEAAIFAAAEWLGQHPEFGTMTDEAEVRPIFYRVDTQGREFDVLRIMDARRVRDFRQVP